MIFLSFCHIHGATHVEREKKKKIMSIKTERSICYIVHIGHLKYLCHSQSFRVNGNDNCGTSPRAASPQPRTSKTFVVACQAFLFTLSLSRSQKLPSYRGGSRY